MEAYSNYIKLLSEVFAGKKTLALPQGEKEYSENYFAKDTNNDNNITFERFNRQLRTDNTDADYDKKITKIDNRNKTEVKEYIDKIIESKTTTRGLCYEFATLFGRNTILSTRNGKILFFKIMQNVVTAILFAILFMNVKKYFFYLIFQKILILIINYLLN